MADIFMQCNAQSLLKNKHILFLGDSNIRAQYKDLIWLLKSNTLINRKQLRCKLEEEYMGDKLVERSTNVRGRDFKENRVYYDQKNDTRLEFIFLTRCFNRRIQDLFNGFKNKSRKVPDVIVINSCLWDLSRWGPNGVPEYKDNMVKLMRMMRQSLPKKCLVLWSTALPTGPNVRGGLLIKQIEFIEPMLRFEVMEANTFAREVVVSHGFDVLDNHFYTRMQMHRRAKDGVHYLPIPVRFMTNLILTHIALTWGRELPKNIKSVLLDKAVALEHKPPEKPEVKVGLFSKINLASPVVPRVRGLAITFNPQQEGRRQCKLFKNEFPEAERKVRSVVQVPQGSQHPRVAAAAGPYRNQRNKKRRRRESRPYQETHHYNRYNDDNGYNEDFYNDEY